MFTARPPPAVPGVLPSGAACTPQRRAQPSWHSTPGPPAPCPHPLRGVHRVQLPGLETSVAFGSSPLATRAQNAPPPQGATPTSSQECPFCPLGFSCLDVSGMWDGATPGLLSSGLGTVLAQDPWCQAGVLQASPGSGPRRGQSSVWPRVGDLCHAFPGAGLRKLEAVQRHRSWPCRDTRAQACGLETESRADSVLLLTGSRWRRGCAWGLAPHRALQPDHPSVA